MFYSQSQSRRGLDIIHADIPQAFVQSLLDVDVWMEFPDGVTVTDPAGENNKVVKLLRSLYGLRNAPQLWNLCDITLMSIHPSPRVNSCCRFLSLSSPHSRGKSGV